MVTQKAFRSIFVSIVALTLFILSGARAWALDSTLGWEVGAGLGATAQRSAEWNEILGQQELNSRQNRGYLQLFSGLSFVKIFALDVFTNINNTTLTWGYGPSINLKYSRIILKATLGKGQGQFSTSDNHTGPDRIAYKMKFFSVMVGWKSIEFGKEGNSFIGLKYDRISADENKIIVSRELNGYFDAIYLVLSANASIF